MADEVRVTQTFTEVLVAPESVADLRVSQSFMEVLFPKINEGQNVRVSQSFMEILVSRKDVVTKTLGKRIIICN